MAEHHTVIKKLLSMVYVLNANTTVKQKENACRFQSVKVLVSSNHSKHAHIFVCVFVLNDYDSQKLFLMRLSIVDVPPHSFVDMNQLRKPNKHKEPCSISSPFRLFVLFLKMIGNKN